ncbi:hypothetical protein ACFW2Y_17655 [Streptomyces sp. NPDC058877]|uniref:hypothetical protein n=1 Tax=Streptomyces sp. NPDC058877 TaxID=3346665 RepID=UPI00368FFC50
MTQNGQGPESQYPPVPPAQGGAQPWGGAWGPAGGQPGGQPLPPAQPLPPEAPPGAADAQSTQYLPPVPPQQVPQPGYGYPGPAAPAADAQSTQYLPPVPPQQVPQPGYGYPGPAAPAAADLQATQHIAPVPPQQGGGPGGQFPGPYAPQGPAGASDATQYIAPVPTQAPGERQPPAEFDNLFRTEAPRPPQQPYAPQGYQQPGPAPYQQPQHHQPQQGAPAGPQGPGGQYAYQDAYYDDDEPAPRRKSPLALIAVVVAGCAVVGLGAGALLSGGGDKKDPQAGGQNVAASSAAPSASAEPTEKQADPAEPQAQELSKLLATSSNSRDAVISSVESIKQCKNLDQAASDLRGAADQRRGLVTELESLSIDKVPDGTALASALTKAWRASAAADDQYAAWADQVAKNKKALCKGGKARSTDQRAAADAKSGEATTAKREAAGLWNPTAAKYGLEKRSYSQL